MKFTFQVDGLHELHSVVENADKHPVGFTLVIFAVIGLAAVVVGAVVWLR